jgi:hypothetical protein
MIKKFRQFNELKFRKILDINESLDEPGIIPELIELSEELNISVIDGFIGSIGDISYTIKINYNKPSYHSSVPSSQILNSIIENIKLDFILDIDVIDNFDKDYVISIIIHEIRHIYDIYTITKKKHFYSFTRDMKIQLTRNDINDSRYSEFLNCIYYSLLHELVARNNQVYPILKNKKISKQESFELIKSTFIYSTFTYLNSFNSEKFVSSFSSDELIKFTNIFNKIYCSSDKEIKNVDDYYHKWELFFKKTKERWFNEMKLEIDKIYETNENDHQIIENELKLILTWIVKNFIE